MKSLAKAARALSAARKTHGGGRPVVLRPCPRCGLEFGTVALRKHKCEAKMLALVDGVETWKDQPK